MLLVIVLAVVWCVVGFLFLCLSCGSSLVCGVFCVVMAGLLMAVLEVSVWARVSRCGLLVFLFFDGFEVVLCYCFHFCYWDVWLVLSRVA